MLLNLFFDALEKLKFLRSDFQRQRRLVLSKVLFNHGVNRLVRGAGQNQIERRVADEFTQAQLRQLGRQLVGDRRLLDGEGLGVLELADARKHIELDSVQSQLLAQI